MAMPVFTGIIEHTGRLISTGPAGSGYRLTLAAAFEQIVAGESIAVNGACLTVSRVTPKGFAADISTETARATTLGRLPAGAELNLERALRLTDRLGGHLVSGHVDGVARVERTEPKGASILVRLIAPEHVLPLLAPKGSVALDGVSLTVNSVAAPRFEVMLVPYTAEHTTLKALRPGAEMNIEADVLARYVVHYLSLAGSEARASADPGSVADRERALLDTLRRANRV